MAKKQKIILSNPSVRKQPTSYGLLGTKYDQKPKFRDKPRQKKVKINHEYISNSN